VPSIMVVATACATPNKPIADASAMAWTFINFECFIYLGVFRFAG
jgi:hypothetical protein